MNTVSTTHPARGTAAVDSPAAHAPARARVAVPAATVNPAPPPARPTREPKQRRVKPPRPDRPAKARLSPPGLMVRRAAARWWAWTARPTSLRAAWHLSAVNRARIPLGSTPVGWIWQISNVTDRLIFFALVLIAPTVLTGPLRWLAARPTRRVAFYLIVAVTAATYLPLPWPGRPR